MSEAESVVKTQDREPQHPGLGARASRPGGAPYDGAHVETRRAVVPIKL